MKELGIIIPMHEFGKENIELLKKDKGYYIYQAKKMSK